MAWLQWLLRGWPDVAPGRVWDCMFLTVLRSDIKEVANVCNQSLMKLVIPEDDEMDETKQSMTLLAEPTSQESLSKTEAASSGESLLG